MANVQTHRPPTLSRPVTFIGREVGRYTVVRPLASGGMAELFIAKQEAMGGFEKPVVLKLLQPRYAENPRVVSMFLDEARLAAKLNHPSIVHLYDVAEDGGLKYIAMEYIHGETVADIVKRGLAVNNYLPLEHAVHIVRQSAAGLGYAHERREADGHVLRIVHRDVSPTNILVSFEGQTKIVDFGIARAEDELREESGSRPGKASYMSPEQVRGEPADYRSDIFSLGIILYELTLCQRLYRGAPEVTMRKIVDEMVTPPTAINRDYPPTLELIVMKALEKRPEDRYQSAEAMSLDLEEFLEESGLRSGNRRMAAYMQELFAPDASTSDAGISASRSFAEPQPQAAQGPPIVVEDNSEELDLDRRAPLAMRIEVAPEPAAPSARGSSAGSGSAKVKAAASQAGSGPARANAAGGGAPALRRSDAPAAPYTDPSTDAQFALKPARPVGWLIIAALIAIAVAAMVIMTLK
ncbi:MAG TPA: serine/threonine-protein kinase [Polyangia bacterium]|jgi:serine/threonine-protein kinase|nr:serine/threonine-protein kinase [Polyangia bacterium]